MGNLLTANHLRAYYKTVQGEEIKAVDDVFLEVKEGEVLGIAGESGCGKSTLASVLSFTILPPLYLVGGEVMVDSKNIFTLEKEILRRDIKGKYISVVPQGAMNSLNPTARIKNFVIDIIKEHFPEMTKEEALRRARERFEALSLPPRILDAYPHQLSGGMKQRTVTVISTLLNPNILIADEPTSALDVSSQKIVIKLFVELLKRNIIKSIVFITHELPLLRHFADRIAIMYAGKIVELGPMEEVIFSPRHPYTKLLMSSVLVPEPGMKEKKIEAIPGVPPDLKNPPSGCRFHPRCPSYIEGICERTSPELIEIAPSHRVSCFLYGGKDVA
jgi:peptide/nickel transport system ATP-binding protein